MNPGRLRLVLFEEPSSRPTVFHAAGEVLDPRHRAVVLPLRSVQLHSGPQAAGELGAAAEPQGPHLSAHAHTHAK